MHSLASGKQTLGGIRRKIPMSFRENANFGNYSIAGGDKYWTDASSI